MSVFVAGRFLLEILLKRLGQVDACLVGEADEDPEDIGHLVAEVVLLVAFLKRLFAVRPGDEAGDFAHFLGQNRHIR